MKKVYIIIYLEYNFPKECKDWKCKAWGHITISDMGTKLLQTQKKMWEAEKEELLPLVMGSFATEYGVNPSFL